MRRESQLRHLGGARKLGRLQPGHGHSETRRVHSINSRHTKRRWVREPAETGPLVGGRRFVKLMEHHDARIVGKACADMVPADANP